MAGSSTDQDATTQFSNCEYDVFISFSISKRPTITDTLYEFLKEEGITIAKVDWNRRPTEELEDSHLDAIKRSRMSIPILCDTYPSYHSCLHELVKIMECSDNGREWRVLPVYLDVAKSDVQFQKNAYETAMAAHEEKGRYTHELEAWKSALCEVGKICGPEIRDEKGLREVRKIVEEVKQRLDSYGRSKRIINTGDWQKGELLGRGSFGSVYKGLSGDGFFFTVKEVSLLDQDNQELEQENSILSRLEHENVVQYYGTKKDNSNMYLFLEYVTEGSLESLYKIYALGESLISAYTRQILLGLKYLHDQNVLHRDIKCANILVDANGSIKLAYFGMAEVIKLNDIKSFRGSQLWMAPEVASKKNQGYGADVWSLGCTVLEMLTRKYPHWDCTDRLKLYFRIVKGKLPSIPDSLSEDAQDFIQQCLQVNPDDRPTAAQLLSHAFIQRPVSHS